MIPDSANSAVRLVQAIIFTALERRAGDIYIKPRATEVTVKYRIDGAWRPAMEPIARKWHPTMLSRLKVWSGVDIDGRDPQQGRFRVRYKGRYIDFGVSTAPARRGQDVLLYVLNKQAIDFRDELV